MVQFVTDLVEEVAEQRQGRAIPVHYLEHTNEALAAVIRKLQSQLTRVKERSCAQRVPGRSVDSACAGTTERTCTTRPSGRGTDAR